VPGCLHYLFVPKFSKLLENILGRLLMFGSYNKFYNKVHIDAAIVSSLDFITSIISSIHRLKISDISLVADKGNGLAFVVYPEALAQIDYSCSGPFSSLACCFFLGLDSEFAFLETILTAVYDGFPKLRSIR
ncbi:Transporter, partial [Caligus rogercresseyi]